MEIEKVKSPVETTKKKARKWLCVAIALMLISMIGASAVQSSGGSVTIKQLYWETDSGIGLSANLYIPKTATPKTPAPAIVTSHGAYNNKEMQDANCVELARRGYVVLAPDQPQQGKSDFAGTNGIVNSNNGVYEGVRLVATLPYVDVKKIGITGHSMGGMSCNSAVAADKTHLISAVLLNSADASYTDAAPGLFVTGGNIANVYGSRDVGIIANQFDEFFFKSADKNGNQLSAPYYMDSKNAQSFLYFGTDPTGQQPRQAATMYHQTIDGKDTIRVIYRPAQIHPWSHFSMRSTTETIEFFQTALPAPSSLPNTDQVWQVKEAFNFIGLVGFVLFIIYFTLLMLYTPYFSSLREEETVRPMKVDKKGMLWFWGSLAAAAVFAMVVYLPILTAGTSAAVQQVETFGIACWAAACGLFAIICMLLSYYLYGKKNGFDLVRQGVKISFPKLAKTVLLAIIVVCVSYGCVFFADYFFKTDFRIWTLAFKAFDAKLIYVSLFPYLPLFLVYYVAASVAANSFNYNQIGGKKSWVNTLIVAVFAAVPAIVMLSVQYITYFNTNHMMWAQVTGVPGNPPMYVLWLFPMILILSVTTVMSRIIFKVSKNPYLPGIINGIIITLFACTNTITRIL